jgi:hypothetical protein
MRSNINIFVGVFLLTLLVSNIYEQFTTKSPIESGKAKRLPCQKNNVSFERGFGDEFIKTAQTQLENGNFKFTSYVEKATYAKSKLFDFIKLSDIDKITQNELNSYAIHKKQNDEKLRISYYIYENDIRDPGKKTKKSKLYAGYVVYKFYNKTNKLIYQSQIDFMDKQGKDINKSVKCAIKSFATFNK